MTAIVGIYCRDGIVIGADSSASFAHTPTFRTFEQRVRKLEVIGGQIILASTGAIGLGQRFSNIVERYWNDKKGVGKSHHEVARELCHLGCEISHPLASRKVTVARCWPFHRVPPSDRSFANSRRPISSLSSKMTIFGLFRWEVANQ
jgi:hypothetical protein